MKYVSRQPREGINVSDVHPLAEAGALVVGLSILLFTVTVLLFFLVDIGLYFVSEKAETRVFSSWVPADYVEADASDERQRAVQDLVDRLVQHWPETSYNFVLKINQSDTPNAMALPGGVIIVSSGLLDQVESENELAFVLGHELGHFRNRDHLRRLGRLAVLSIAFQVLASSETGTPMVMTIADLTLRGFGREEEIDADRFGLELVNAQYSHVDQAARFFTRLEESDSSVSGLASYLSTHPAADQRIDAIAEYARTKNWFLTGPTEDVAWAKVSKMEVSNAEASH